MRKFAFLPVLLIVASPAFADPWAGIRSAGTTSARAIESPRDIRPPAGRERLSIGAPDFANPQVMAYHEPSPLGGGFIEFLLTGRTASPRHESLPRSHYLRPQYEIRRGTPDWSGRTLQVRQQAPDIGVRAMPRFDPRYERQIVPYFGNEKPGTIVIDTSEKFLYLVQEDGTAIRYGVGVGRDGFGWTGVKHISAKREWPDWRPPPEMLKRQPDLPRYMPGGIDNPLGARALYLGDSLYRIHGSNEPWTIGQAVSSGCFRMRNEDVIDLYERVTLGTRVVVI